MVSREAGRIIIRRRRRHLNYSFFIIHFSFSFVAAPLHHLGQGVEAEGAAARDAQLGVVAAAGADGQGQAARLLQLQRRRPLPVPGAVIAQPELHPAAGLGPEGEIQPGQVLPIRAAVAQGAGLGQPGRRRLRLPGAAEEGEQGAALGVDGVELPLQGGEGQGVSQIVRSKADYIVSIPMKGRVNSLNASNAAAILLYEVDRQRTLAAKE